jgi:hypothetical protein
MSNIETVDVQEVQDIVVSELARLLEAFDTDIERIVCDEEVAERYFDDVLKDLTALIECRDAIKKVLNLYMI